MADDARAAFEKEKNDPEMLAYLKSLGLDPDYVPPKDDPRRVVVQSLTIEFEDHESAVLQFDTAFAGKEDNIVLKEKNPIVIKEGAQFKISVQFRVQHQIVHGFKIQSTVKKVGKKVADDEAMLGSFAPSNEYTSIAVGDFQDAPSGMMFRGDYKSHMKFVDDDGKQYVDIEYEIKISKDWK